MNKCTTKSKFTPIGLLLLIVVNFLVIGCPRQNKEPILSQKPNPNSSDKLCQSLNMKSINNNIKLTKPWRIGYIFKTSSDPFWQRMGQAVEQVSQELGIKGTVKFTVNTPDAKEDVKNQIRIIFDLVKNKKVDALIIAPEDSIQLVSVIEKATNEGIPVIIIDTPIDTNQILTFITFDNFQAGKLMGEWVVKKLEKIKLSEKNINVLILEGSLHEENTIERRQGFLEGLKSIKKDYNLDILDMKTANWETSQAKKNTADWLQKFSDIDVIMAADDQMAIGASQAVQEAQKSGIMITGFDGMLPGLHAIKAGQIHATIDQIPEKQIKLTTQLMISYLENRNQTFPPCQLIGKNQVKTSLLITSENINTYLK